MLSKLYFSIKKLEKNVLNEYKLKNNNENKIIWHTIKNFKIDKYHKNK